MKSQKPAVLKAVAEKKALDDELKQNLTDAIKDFKKSFVVNS